MTSPPRPVLFCDHGCPFTHRVRALLHHLGVEPDLREAPHGQRPEGLARYSPSERIPFLVHGAVEIAESRVMLEHLAEAYDFAAAYPEALESRTAARHAMAVVDGLFAPAFQRADAVPSARRLAELLDVLEALASSMQPAPSLLAFHVGPLWLALQRYRSESSVTRAIRERASLATWLDALAALDAVARTTPCAIPAAD